MKDPYGILGVKRGASLDEIKSAYRQRAKELHPDANVGDAAAAQKFLELQEAYDALTDPDGPPAGAPAWTFEHGMTPEDYARGSELSDLFGDIAGNRRGRVSGAASTSMNVPGEDLAHPMRLTEEEAAAGVHRTIDLVTGHTLTIEIEPGAQAGDVVSFPGYGFPGFGGGMPGNLNVIIEILPTPEIEPRRQDPSER